MGRRIGFTRDDRMVVLELWRCRCVYCGAPVAQDETSAVDHVVPWSLGGMHALCNVAASCATCNGRKGALRLVEHGLVAERAADIARRVAAAIEANDEMVLGVEVAVVRRCALVRAGRVLSGPTIEGSF